MGVLTTLSDGAFASNYNLLSLSVPNTVTTFGQGVFRDCTSLASVSMPLNLTTISSYAFYGCTSLTSLDTTGSYITGVDEFAFAHCSNLSSVLLSDNITFINQGAFIGCPLTTFTTPYNLTTIGQYCFQDNQLLSYFNVSNPNALTNVSGNIFPNYGPGVNQVTTMYFSSNFNSLNNNAKYLLLQRGSTNYYNPYGLQSVFSFSDNSKIVSTATILTSDAYQNKQSTLVSVSIGLQVTKLDDNCFNGCFLLSSIKIPNTSISIGDNVFSNCSRLSSFIFEDQSTLGTIGTNVFSLYQLAGIQGGLRHSCPSRSSKVHLRMRTRPKGSAPRGEVQGRGSTRVRLPAVFFFYGAIAGLLLPAFFFWW